jgi:isopentenyl diphosphate isomerase/L-lactate dehydrogenase-like FMN-dependent dehydrogenase
LPLPLALAFPFPLPFPLALPLPFAAAAVAFAAADEEEEVTAAAAAAPAPLMFATARVCTGEALEVTDSLRRAGLDELAARFWSYYTRERVRDIPFAAANPCSAAPAF